MEVGVANARARRGSRTTVAATTIFHAWVVYIPLIRRDTARDALDLVSNFHADLLRRVRKMRLA